MAEVVVIGPYPAYVELATTLRATTFVVPLDRWEAMDPEQQWAVNREFLDAAAARGATFLLAVPPDQARTDSYFARERDYLLSLGFRVRRGETHWEMFR